MTAEILPLPARADRLTPRFTLAAGPALPRSCMSESCLPSLPLPLALQPAKRNGQTCPICLVASDEPPLRLICNHMVCVPCGEKASKFGIKSCPQCRAPHVLDLNVLRSRLNLHRSDYQAWRMGKTRGAKGELDGLVMPENFSLAKDLAMFHPACGLLHMSAKRKKDDGSVPLKPRKAQELVAPVDARPAMLEIPTEALALGVCSLVGSTEPTSDLKDSKSSMYAKLLGPSNPNAAIIFAWWPRSKGWRIQSIVRYATRALPALRPGVDAILLPRLPIVRQIFSIWCIDFGLELWQAIWYNLEDEVQHPPRAVEEPAERPEAGASEQNFERLVAALHYSFPFTQLRQKYVVYTQGLTSEWRSRITALGFGCIGDLNMHPTLGSLDKAKGWLHPRFSNTANGRRDGDIQPGETRSASLAEALICNELNIGEARPPRGFVCLTADEQRAAFQLLRTQYSARVVLKPTDGLGCAGLVLDASEADLAPAGSGAIPPCIVEELIGGGTADEPASPTIYMCGDQVLAIADQLMVGAGNEGNAIPASCSTRVQEAMAVAGAAIGSYLGLTSQWGMDVVIDPVSGVPVIVDLNMGRPNGSLSNYLWRSRQVRPEGALDEVLHQIMVMRKAPADETVFDFVGMLKDNDIFWTDGGSEGVLPCAHVPDARGHVLCASWNGAAAVRKLVSRLISVDRVGEYRLLPESMAP